VVWSRDYRHFSARLPSLFRKNNLLQALVAAIGQAATATEQHWLVPHTVYDLVIDPTSSAAQFGTILLPVLKTHAANER
jgi:hypothetical protein